MIDIIYFCRTKEGRIFKNKAKIYRTDSGECNFMFKQYISSECEPVSGIGVFLGNNKTKN